MPQRALGLPRVPVESTIRRKKVGRTPDPPTPANGTLPCRRRRRPAALPRAALSSDAAGSATRAPPPASSVLYSLGSRATYVPGGRTVYADSPGDALLVTALTRVLCAALGCAPPTPASAYAGFVAVAFVLARGRTAAQQHAFVQATLEATATPGVLGVVRWLVRGLTALRFPVNLAMAAGTVPFAGWLVGPASVADGSLGAAWAAPGAPATVVLRRCRFLEASSCRSACFNVCKVPTQAFFEQSVGVALTMRPDYETLECRMTFGELAPAPQDDEAAHGPCFTACTAAAARAADALGCETAAAREAVRR